MHTHGDLVAGSRLGPYEVLSALGAGGMGVVYRARDSRLQRDVALKVLPPDASTSSEGRARLQREARAVAALQHPNICTIHDVGETSDGRLYLVMELLQGETLEQRLRRGPLGPAEAIDMAVSLCAALDSAHAASLIHRDVKPANIFLSDHGPKLLDFGLAKELAAAAPGAITTELLTEAGAIVGTVNYMSPEQVRGEAIDRRSDLFSLGVVLYEMVTGRRPFAAGTTVATAAAVMHDAPSRARSINAGVSPALDDCIERAIAKPRDLRFQSAADFAGALRHTREVDSRAAQLPHAPRTRIRIIPAAVAGLVVIGLVGFGLYVRPRAQPLTDRDTIVVGDFRNTTGEALFDEALRQGLTVQLQQSPFLSVVPDAKVRRTLTMMARKPDTAITGDVASEVCKRTSSAAYLEGSIAPLGSRYVVALTATACADDSQINQGQLEVARKEDVLGAIGTLAAQFRARSGETLATRQRYDVPLAEATTSSLDALKAYSAARRVNDTEGPPAAIPLLRRATEIDPQFATAWALLGLCYNVSGEAAASVDAATRAYQLRERTTDRERFLIAALYERQVTGNLEKARQTFESYVATYPRDVDAHGLLAGYSTHGTGRYTEAIDHANQLLVIDPGFSFGYANLVSANMYLDRSDDAAAALKRADQAGVMIPGAPLLRYQLGYVRGDAEMMRQAEAAAAKDPMPDLELLRSLAAARAGRWDEARAAAQHAVSLASTARQQEAASAIYAVTADWEALFGHVDQARQAASHALERSQGRDAMYATAFALARIDDHARADQLTATLAERFPEDTSVRFSYLPTLRALQALRSHDAAKAIAALEEARTNEDGIPAIAFIHGPGWAYPSFVRAEALTVLGRRADAAKEYQRILAHRGLLSVDPIGAIVERELKRLTP